MLIDLRDGWQTANEPSKIYLVGLRDRECIDETFDKLTD